MSKYPPIGIIEAPFTKEEIAGLKAWQVCPWVHPFTCCDHVTMNVTREGFVCPKCGTVQDWAHTMMANGPPPNPMEGLFDETDL